MTASIDSLNEFCQRIPSHVRIIAVTKTHPIAVIETVYAAGIRDIGENRVQEAIAKHEQLASRTDLTWHLIGHLQSNKVRKALEIFDWIHSIDSLKLAETVDRVSQTMSRPKPQLCLQVKFVPDPDKSGWNPTELISALPQLDQLEHIQIRGLMVIPPFNLSAERLQTVFQTAKTLQTELQAQQWQRLQFDQLSMGMSNDYEAAIAQGATMIRPGRCLFGDRS
jgi:PLP dependent protein